MTDAPTQRLIIAGTRHFDDESLLASRMAARPVPAVVLCGMARGADELGRRWAVEHEVEVWKYPADWARYGKKAGPIRNAAMAKYATHLIAFWDGQSKGTFHMIKEARRVGLDIEVVRY